MTKKRMVFFSIFLCVCWILSACQSKKTAVKPVEADRIMIVHEVKDGVSDAETMVTDEETVAEIVQMHNTLQIQAMSRPMDEDRLVLTFYADDEEVAVWRISVWADDGMVITCSGETFGLGNYIVKNDFDYDRLMERLKLAES